MEVKRIEVRDAATTIPAIAIRLILSHRIDRHAGWPKDSVLVYFGRLNSEEALRQSCWDWHATSRTMPEAHRLLEQRWDDFQDGEVLDVEFELGETEVKKLPELL